MNRSQNQSQKEQGKETIQNAVKNGRQRSKIKGLQLFSQCTIIGISSIFFGKLIIFNHYKRFNLTIKLLFLYLYTATLDPLVVGTGYFVTKMYKNNAAAQNITKIQNKLKQQP